MRSANASTSRIATLPAPAMSGFQEPRPDLVQPNPGGPDDPLGESVMDASQPWLRIFEPRDVRLVIGRHQDPQRELDCPAAARDGIPIHRRVAGGGAVVLAPGMVVLAVRMARDHLGTTTYLERVNRVLIPALAPLIDRPLLSIGLGDLALVDSDALPPRKILGASLRQSAGLVIYLGCLLIEDHAGLMARYLRPPSRQPSYRDSRPHGSFCTHLAAHGASGAGVRQALTRACQAGLAP